jgi:hypothetical protein
LPSRAVPWPKKYQVNEPFPLYAVLRMLAWLQLELPPVQVPEEQVAPAAHWLPHAPQLLALVCVLTQELPHRVRPGLHAQLPPEQLALAWHTLPHVPQLLPSVWVLTQLLLQKV